MYNKDDKRRLYWLIEQYLSGKIIESLFCDEFYYCYDLELDKNTLSKTEYEQLEELNNYIVRFSPYEEDYKLDPSGKAFFTVEQLRQIIIETKTKLKVYFPTEENG